MFESEMPFSGVCASRRAPTDSLSFVFFFLHAPRVWKFAFQASLLRSIGILYHRPRMGVAAKIRAVICQTLDEFIWVKGPEG